MVRNVLLIMALLALPAHAQVTRNTLEECRQVRGVVQVVLRADGRCDAFTAADMGKRPAHAKTWQERGEPTPPATPDDERIQKLEAKIKALEDNALIRK